MFFHRLSMFERFSVVTQAIAVLLAVVAAFVNVVVGPFSLGVCCMPVAMLGCYACLFLLVQMTDYQANAHDVFYKWGRALLGKRMAYRLRRFSRGFVWIVAHSMLAAVTLFCGVISVLVLIHCLQGKIAG